jgi:hypothetical protein
MQVFWLPPDAYCQSVCSHREGRGELSLVVHSDRKIDVPPLPVLFTHHLTVWVAVRYSEVEPGLKQYQYCFHLDAQCVISLHELAKLVRGNAKDGFCIAQPSNDNARPGLFSPQQKAMFNNYCEARTTREAALSNYQRAEVSRDQVNALYLQTQKTWLQADGMLKSIEEDCRNAGFDPACYLKDEADA